MARTQSALERPTFAGSKWRSNRAQREHASASVYVKSGDLIMVWRRKQNRRRTLCWTLFMICYIRSVFSSLPGKRLKSLRSAYVREKERKNKNATKVGVTNVVCTVTRTPSKNKIRSKRQKVIEPISESFVLLVSTIAGIRPMNLKPLCREKHQHSSAEAMGTCFSQNAFKS